MKISKNTLLGLGALTALAVVGLFAFSAHKAAAQNAAFTPDQLSAARYRLISNAEIQVTIGGTIYVFIDANPIDGSHNFKARNTDMFCGGTTVGNGGIQNALKGITLDTSFDALVAGGGDSLNAVANLDYTDASGTCQNYQSPIVFTKQADGSFVGGVAPAAVGDPCTGGADCGTDGTCQKAGGDCTNQPIPDTCNDNAFGFSLTWLACPLLDAADSATNHIYTLFEDQLSFSIEQLGQDGQTQIQKSWSLMRDIATAMIVVVALIMVLSQAVSFGPFDAYTVRKMLPRIVAAVILIQISWVGVKFAIDIVNAIAQGIADLMYYPFGGADNMNLFALLAHAGLSNGELTAINWAGLGVFVALGSAFLFTILGLAFAGILALLVALFTLIFRKILIILLIIFAPLAFLAWILPGTERYWKMWRENLIKVLFMFPIVVALIAAGRIFAYVVGAQPNNSLANSGHLMNLIFVLVGFFGPLFILPKTFKWGGQAMGLASGAISSAGTKVGERPKKYFGKRQEEYSHQKSISAAGRLRSWDQGQLSKRGKVMSALRGDKFRAGDWDIAYNLTKLPGVPGGKEMARQQEEKMQRFRAAAAKAENEEREFATLKLREEAAHSEDYGPGKEDKFYEHVWEEFKAGNRSESEGFAALEELAVVGGEPAAEYILKEGNLAHQEGNATTATHEQKERNVAFGKFATRAAPTLFPKMQNLAYYKGDAGAAGGIKAAELVKMASPAVRIMIENLNNTLNSTTASVEDKRKAREGLENLSSAFQMAASAEQYSRDIGPGLRRVFENEASSGKFSSGSSAAIKQGLSQMGVAVASTPGEIKVQHEETIRHQLPPESVLAPGSADREAFKLQLKTSPQIFETVANGIASGAIHSGSEHYKILSELRADAHSAGTPEAIADWNSKVDRIQQAYNSHLDKEVAAITASGVNPADARELALATPMHQIDPATGTPVIDPATGRPLPGKTVAEEIMSLEVTPPGATPNPIGKL